jgi:tetratricopeptide (TPR) repeat protein
MRTVHLLKRMHSRVAVLFCCLLLVACESAEERAATHYARGLALLEENDVDRAVVEFQNVLRLDELHAGARLAFAQAQDDRGNTREAYGHFLRLVEQDPENLPARRALSRIAADLSLWDEVARHVTVANTLAPDDPIVRAVSASLDYRNALDANDPAAAAQAVAVSVSLLDSQPDIATARRVVIDDLVRRNDWAAALTAIDAALDRGENRDLSMLRLGVLEQLGRDAEVIAQIEKIVSRYPDDGLHRTLVDHYVSQGQLETVETYLRDRSATAAPDDQPRTQAELIAFLQENIGLQAALAEIDRMLAGSPQNPDLLRSARAWLIYEAGDRAAAMADLRDLLDQAAPSAQTDRIRLALAQMLIDEGRVSEARALVDAVIARDPGQVQALKLQAAWLIEEDRPDDALIQLREAHGAAPRDPEILTLMAKAHDRAGNRELVGEMLSLAVEASARSPEETLRYTQFLVQDGRFLPAEDVLVAALRLHPDNPQLLAVLGNLYLRMEDWRRMDHVIATLRDLETTLARNEADELTAAQLAARDKTQELEAFLTALSDVDSGLPVAPPLIRVRQAQGDIDGALAYAETLLADDPDNPTLRFLRAGVLIQAGRTAEAVASLEGILRDTPRAELVWTTLYRLHLAEGDSDRAAQVLADARTALPENPTLKLAAASEAEAAGNIDGAIAIYEDLYATNSNSVVIANNLASLISSYREDEASLDRAYRIARRLRGTSVPAFQDTYGWIAHRLGNHEEAVDYLEPAARALAGDPAVQYHLAEVYLSLGRDADALAQFEMSAALVPEGQVRPPFMDRVDAETDRLSAELN